MPGIMCPAFIFLPDKNNTTSIETPCCFIQRKTPVRICPLPKAGFSNGFSGGQSRVAFPNGMNPADSRVCLTCVPVVPVRICVLSAFSGRAGKRICARRAIGLRHQPGGFSRGKKLVACFLKLVARISKSEPLIFSLLPCRVNTLKTNFQFSAPENGDFNGNKTVINGGNDSNRADVGNGNNRSGLIAPPQRRSPPGVCVRRDCSLLLSYRRATVWPVPLSPCS